MLFGIWLLITTVGLAMAITALIDGVIRRDRGAAILGVTALAIGAASVAIMVVAKAT